jgi:hypothetical protein
MELWPRLVLRPHPFDPSASLRLWRRAIASGRQRQRPATGDWRPATASRLPPAEGYTCHDLVYQERMASVIIYQS